MNATMSNPLKRVISGGQTGADLAALCAAKVCRIDTGGTAPRGFRTTLGSDYTLASRYNLIESSSCSYVTRSKKNVDDSDATIAFRLRASPGTDKTVRYCATGRWQTRNLPTADTGAPYRLCLVVTDLSDELKVVADIVAFVARIKPKTLNVCGHRDGRTAGKADF